MEIIINCKNCKNKPKVIKTKNQTIIKCCDNKVKEEMYIEAVDKWNNLNNNYDSIFGIIYEMDLRNNEMKKSLDGFTIIDEITKEKFRIYQSLLKNELINISLATMNNLFPEVTRYTGDINGLRLREKSHLPNYSLHKISTGFKMERECLSDLVKTLSGDFLSKSKI